MNLREIGYECVDLIHLPQCRDEVADCCEHGNEPSISIVGGVFLN
jgi:hypothetical protein